MIESTQELGNDLAGVMALQRKLTGMERDLVAIEDKLGDLGKEAERLASEHPEQSVAIKGRLAEITGVWDDMKVGGWQMIEANHRDRPKKRECVFYSRVPLMGRWTAIETNSTSL